MSVKCEFNEANIENESFQFQINLNGHSIHLDIAYGQQSQLNPN